jgi:hypothetical protein
LKAETGGLRAGSQPGLWTEILSDRERDRDKRQREGKGGKEKRRGKERKGRERKELYRAIPCISYVTTFGVK